MTDFFTDPKYTIHSNRLILRPPQPEDFPALENMSQDEQTMRFIGGVSEPALAWRNFAMLSGHWSLRGYGFFSVIEKATGKWIGRVGPWNPHLWPEPEVGWTIIRSHWGQGFAREASIAAINWTFDHLQWQQVTHMIDPGNIPSQALARTLGSKPLREIDELPGFGAMKIVIWGQSRDEWAGQKHG
ncbi:Protein export cytoplasm protein SecA ATPase RNA helicase (TC 3.A.5.1.1) [hydrothermal vent metagenome]|uniref:Protein export cytoplasm protein SecA ATPase RNA helicase (TC 3.A.5.1.1) n=1 Tax=hydrothermal vent metagenome TaxID=652676 RepID=A0A3B0QZL3_9ZZZZ